MAGINMIQLSSRGSILPPKEQQLSAVCVSKRSTSSPGASGECYYYSTLGKKTGWRS